MKVDQSAWGTPIKAADIGSEKKNNGGIGSGDGGPSDERAGESGTPISTSGGDITRGTHPRADD
jgi:hypothetical protein